MGNLSSSYQEVEVSPNGKWLILVKSDAYINVACVAFIAVVSTSNGYRITFKLVDNDNDKSDDGWHSWEGQPISKVQTVEMNKREIDTIINALLRK